MNKKYIAGMFALLAIGVALNFALPAFTATTYSVPVAQDKQGLGGYFVWEQTRDGKVIASNRYVPNTVTNMGKNITRDMLAGGVALNNITQMELSNETWTPNATTNKCGWPITGNGLDIAYAAPSVVAANVGNASFAKTWTATGTVSDIYKICLSNSSTTASTMMFASAWLNATTAAPVNLANGDQLTVTYYIGVT